MYRTIELSDDEDNGVSRIASLFRTLHTKPNLASIVGDLTIYPVQRRVKLNLGECLSIPAGARSIFESNDYYSRMSETSGTGYLLALLPGLRRLEIGVWNEVYHEEVIENGYTYEESYIEYKKSSYPLLDLFGMLLGTKLDSLLKLPGL
jgi:hypothetical protein